MNTSTLKQNILDNLNLNIQYNALLSEYTTFRLGGLCPVLINCSNPNELCHIVNRLAESKTKYILIGGGSNLLISDEGLDCAVIHYATDDPIITRKDDDLIVSGSTKLDDLVKFTAQNGLKGLSFATGIPGTVGGAIVGNAGAFGEQIADVLKSVTLINKAGNERKVEPKSLGFRYRYSHLKETDDIVMWAQFDLIPAEKKDLLNQRENILKLREEKHPNFKLQPCAGSFFKNIEPSSRGEKRQATGWFLEQADVKNFKVGGARVFEKHANIIIKSEECTAQDVFDLSCRMAQAVHNKFGVELVREVRLVGKFKGIPKTVQSIIW